MIDGHNAWYDGRGHAQGSDGVYKVEIRIGIKKVLGNRRIGARVHFIDKALNVGLCRCRLWVKFGVSGHFYMKKIARFLANKFNQFIGITKVASRAHARRHIAAQSHQTMDAQGLIIGQNVAQTVARTAHAR